MSEKDATIFCLTPVLNEAWILDRFIRCASTWADHIVIADQRSTDETRAIANRHEKVVLIENPGTDYSESFRQNLLIEAAREMPCGGKRILIALDADEALSANWKTSAEWQRVLEAPPGTVIGFKWANILPGGRRAWLPPDDKWFGFVDDGSGHDPHVIHSPRLPQKDHHPRLRLSEIRALHFQYVDWERMLSKQRWYQAWERINFPEKRPIQIFRQYNHMHAIPPEEIVPIRDEWFAGYEEAGIDMRDLKPDGHYRWDPEVLELIEQHGAETFRRVAIWDKDWQRLGHDLRGNDRPNGLADPRSNHERFIHDWLQRTQPKADTLPVRMIQKCLQVMGW